MPPVKQDVMTNEACKYRHGNLLKLFASVITIIVTFLFFLLNSDAKLEAAIVPIAANNATIDQKIINVDVNVKEIRSDVKEIKQVLHKLMGKYDGK